MCLVVTQSPCLIVTHPQLTGKGTGAPGGREVATGPANTRVQLQPPLPWAALPHPGLHMAAKATLTTLPAVLILLNSRWSWAGIPGS